jgi:hypothetical protein
VSPRQAKRMASAACHKKRVLRQGGMKPIAPAVIGCGKGSAQPSQPPSGDLQRAPLGIDDLARPVAINRRRRTLNKVKCYCETTNREISCKCGAGPLARSGVPEIFSQRPQVLKSRSLKSSTQLTSPCAAAATIMEEPCLIDHHSMTIAAIVATQPRIRRPRRSLHRNPNASLHPFGKQSRRPEKLSANRACSRSSRWRGTNRQCRPTPRRRESP